MVLLTITPTILATLESLSPSLRDELSLPSPEVNAPISHTQLIALSRHFTSESPSNYLAFADRLFKSEDSKEPNSESSGQRQAKNSVRYSLNALLRGVRLYIPPPPPKPVSDRLPPQVGCGDASLNQFLDHLVRTPRE